MLGGKVSAGSRANVHEPVGWERGLWVWEEHS